MEKEFCTKKGYKSKSSALSFARDKGSWVSKVAGRVRAYFCDLCHLWHVTTKEREKKVRKRGR